MNPHRADEAREAEGERACIGRMNGQVALGVTNFISSV